MCVRVAKARGRPLGRRAYSAMDAKVKGRKRTHFSRRKRSAIRARDMDSSSKMSVKSVKVMDL